jgi:hypothetical protein
MAQPAISTRVDRWGYNQDLGILFVAHQNQQPCPPNADQLIQAALTRMGKQHLPPQFHSLVLDLKAQSWNTLVTNDIPGLQAQTQALQAQNQALQAQNQALQAQNQAQNN